MKAQALVLMGAAMACGCASMPFSDRAAPSPRVEAAPTPGRTTSDRMDDARRGVADAAIAPLKDVGLVRPEIPPVLAQLDFPYEVEKLGGACAQVSYELGQLDAVLGAEVYLSEEAKRSMRDKGMDAAGDAAADAMKGAATDLIPFRGIVRKASGADRAAKDFAEARALGQMRRAFLRGYGAALGCPAVLPAAPSTIAGEAGDPRLRAYAEPPVSE